MYCKKCGSPVNYEDIKVMGQCPHCGCSGTAPVHKLTGPAKSLCGASGYGVEDDKQVTCHDCHILSAHMLAAFGSRSTPRSGNLEEKLDAENENSAVHHPDHYGGKGPYEVIRVTEHFKLNHNMATIVTYLLRAGKKDPYPQDLSKALWYLVRELAKVKGGDPNDWVELIPEEFRS